MQVNSAEHQPVDSSTFLGVSSSFVDGMTQTTDDSLLHEVEPVHFKGFFASTMEMYTDAQMVAHYLNNHREWFCRCANPMKADPLGESGYALGIGRFGALGYEVEPKIGLILLPPDEYGVYRIETVPIPNYVAPGYDVDFRASLKLVEMDPMEEQIAKDHAAPSQLTQVMWELNLMVSIHFPRFIHALPKHLVQSTGDRVLNQIVRQVSRRLTHKVQDDFHSTHNIPFGKKHRRNWPLKMGG